MSNADSILKSPLAQQNVTLAKISVCKAAGWAIPDTLRENAERLEFQIKTQKVEIEKEAQR